MNDWFTRFISRIADVSFAYSSSISFVRLPSDRVFNGLIIFCPVCSSSSFRATSATLPPFRAIFYCHHTT
jgi:hypothetical protein